MSGPPWKGNDQDYEDDRGERRPPSGRRPPPREEWTGYEEDHRHEREGRGDGRRRRPPRNEEEDYEDPPEGRHPRRRMRRHRERGTDPRPIRFGMLQFIMFCVILSAVVFFAAGLFWLGLVVYFIEGLVDAFEAWGWL